MRAAKMDNVKQQCIKVDNFTDEAPYNLNLSVSGNCRATVLKIKPTDNN
jgi:hypothetical protein